MFFKQAKNLGSGQTLVSLLVFVAIALTITSAALTILLNSIESGMKHLDGILALEISESGAENALLKLVRNPNYTGETLTVGDGNAVIAIAQGSLITITSTGRVRNSVRKIQLEMIYNIGILKVVSWKELY